MISAFHWLPLKLVDNYTQDIPIQSHFGHQYLFRLFLMSFVSISCSIWDYFCQILWTNIWNFWAQLFSGWLVDLHSDDELEDSKWNKYILNFEDGWDLDHVTLITISKNTILRLRFVLESILMMDSSNRLIILIFSIGLTAAMTAVAMINPKIQWSVYQHWVGENSKFEMAKYNWWWR